ncbi:unnamed protein product [Schistocephalus solidus]|uniref:Uncharacterized protein n=1 Tax=Schistocephalus solidus TaxID=70667 RepID=A0A183T2X3_SCHSO|nr:unnamed protein product [Schistocephalus solidus]
MHTQDTPGLRRFCRRRRFLPPLFRLLVVGLPFPWFSSSSSLPPPPPPPAACCRHPPHRSPRPRCAVTWPVFFSCTLVCELLLLRPGLRIGKPSEVRTDTGLRAAASARVRHASRVGMVSQMRVCLIARVCIFTDVGGVTVVRRRDDEGRYDRGLAMETAYWLG